MQNSVSQNAFWIILCKLAEAILALFINMLTARYLGPSKYGIIVYASSLVAFVLPIVQLGFNNVLVKEIIDYPQEQGNILGSTILFSSISSFFLMICVTGFAYISNKSNIETTIVCFLYSFVLFFQSLNLIQYWYQAHLKSKITSIISLIAFVVVSAYKSILLINFASIYLFAISNVLDYAIISCAQIFICLWKNKITISFSYKLGLSILSRSYHYILSSLMVRVFAQTDKIMLNIMEGDSATGIYGVALSSACLSSFVFAAIIDSFRPHVLDAQKTCERVFNFRLTCLYSIIIYFSLIQSILTTIFSKYIILILYGKDYIDSVIVLQISVWFTTFSYLGVVRNIWVLAKQCQKILVPINSIGAIANILLNCILIPFYGVIGAAIASVFTQFFTNVIVSYAFKDLKINNQLLLRCLRPKYFLMTFNHFFLSQLKIKFI